MFVPQNRFDRLLPFRGKKMLFVHTPKCGGSYIGAAFGCRFKACISVNHPKLMGHLTFAEYKTRFQQLGQNIEDYSVFSVIRNPWQWHVSWYQYVRGDVNGERSGLPYEHNILQHMSFLDYLKWLDEHYVTGKPNQYYFKQICDWVSDENGEIVVDDILRQETIQQDLEKLANKHHILLHLPKKRINQSFAGDFRKEYCSEGVDIVARRHARDIELFKYAFE